MRQVPDRQVDRRVTATAEEKEIPHQIPFRTTWSTHSRPDDMESTKTATQCTANSASRSSPTYAKIKSERTTFIPEGDHNPTKLSMRVIADGSIQRLQQTLRFSHCISHMHMEPLSTICCISWRRGSKELLLSILKTLGHSEPSNAQGRG